MIEHEIKPTNLPEGELVVRTIKDNVQRDATDKLRFDTLYGPQCHYRNTEFYDIVVDTTATTQAEKCKQVIDGWESWAASK